MNWAILRPALVAVVLALSAASTAAAQARSSPPQAWAHRDGLVALKPNGAVRADPSSVLDRLMIQEAFARWGVAYDEMRFDVIRSLFTPDAVFEVTLASAKPIARAVGPEAIVANVATALKQQGDQRRHAITNIVIDSLTDRDATAIAYGVVVNAKNGLSLGATVIYAADLKKGPDGVWRFSRYVIGMDEYAGRLIDIPKPGG